MDGAFRSRLNPTGEIAFLCPVKQGYGCASGFKPSLIPNDFTYCTSCQRCASGSLDHTGIPFHATPLVNSQNNVPSVTSCTSGARRLGPFFPPVPVAPWHSEQ